MKRGKLCVFFAGRLRWFARINGTGKTAAGVLLPSALDAACGRQRPDRSYRTGDRSAYRQNHRRKPTTGCRFHHI